jgi:hypothetical protein
MRNKSLSVREARFGENIRSHCLEATLDRIDQLVRPSKPCDHSLVEPPEPGQLQELRARNANTPSAPSQKPRASIQRPRNFSGSRSITGTTNTTRVARRQVLDPGSDPGLDLAQWDSRDHPPDYRRKVLPQPRLEKKQGRAGSGDASTDAAAGASPQSNKAALANIRDAKARLENANPSGTREIHDPG